MNTPELLTVVQNTAALAPTGPRITRHHRAGTDGTLDLLPFEQEMVDIVNKFNVSLDAGERVELMKQYQKLHTENVWIGRSRPVPGRADPQQAASPTFRTVRRRSTSTGRKTA